MTDRLCGHPTQDGGTCEIRVPNGICPVHGRRAAPATAVRDATIEVAARQADAPPFVFADAGRPGVLQLAQRGVIDLADALRPYSDALTLVGALAVYLRTGDADLTVEPTTSDGDFAVDPDVLALVELDQTMDESLRKHGFHPVTAKDGRGQHPGQWARRYDNDEVTVGIDLMVPTAVGAHSAHGKAGRRSFQAVGQPKNTLRTADGLDACVYDRDILRVSDGERERNLYVASGPSLLIAKAYKIADRQGDLDRLSDKDALDTYRILASHNPAEAGRRLADLAVAHPHISPVVAQGIEHLAGTLSTGGLGPDMLRRAIGTLADPEEIIGRATAAAEAVRREFDARR